MESGVCRRGVCWNERWRRGCEEGHRGWNPWQGEFEATLGCNRARGVTWRSVYVQVSSEAAAESDVPCSHSGCTTPSEPELIAGGWGGSVTSMGRNSLCGRP